MQTNLSGLAEALGFTRQYANRLSKAADFPYLQKPGEQGAKRWRVDVGQVRRWLEEKDAEKVQAEHNRRALAREEQAYRNFWRIALNQGYTPDHIAYYRDRCETMEQLEKQARRMGFSLDY